MQTRASCKGKQCVCGGGSTGAALHPLPPLLYTSRSLKPAGQHKTAPATLPKSCKPLPSGHLTLLVLFDWGSGSYFAWLQGPCLNPWRAKRPVSAHHYTKLQHKQAADAVYWEAKENESQLLTSGMNRVNLRRNRFIFRMVSQESLKQIARNLGY